LSFMMLGVFPFLFPQTLRLPVPRVGVFGSAPSPLTSFSCLLRMCRSPPSIFLVSAPIESALQFLARSWRLHIPFSAPIKIAIFHSDHKSWPEIFSFFIHFPSPSLYTISSSPFPVRYPPSGDADTLSPLLQSLVSAPFAFFFTCGVVFHVFL